MTLVGTSSPAPVRNFFERLLLARTSPYLLHGMFGEPKPIPKASGKTIQFRRYAKLSPVTTPLTEGVTPAGQSVSVTNITATVAQYMGWIRHTDMLEWTAEDRAAIEFVEMLAEQAGESLDLIDRNALLATTNIQYASTAVSRVTVAATMVLNDAECKEARRNFLRRDIRPITSIILPGQGYNTSPVKPAFVGIVHPDIIEDVEALTGFTPVEKYASYQPVHEAEVGTAFQIRFLATTQARIYSGAGAAGIDVYSTLVIGRVKSGPAGAPYGITTIDNESLDMINKPLGSAGADDPGNQRASLSWKASRVTTVLNDYAVLNLEHAKD